MNAFRFSLLTKEAQASAETVLPDLKCQVKNDSLETLLANANFWLRARCSIMQDGVLGQSFLRLNHLALLLVKPTHWQTSPVAAEPSGEIDAQLRWRHLSFWHRHKLFRNNLDSLLCGPLHPSISLCLQFAEATDRKLRQTCTISPSYLLKERLHLSILSYWPKLLLLGS